MRWATLNGWWYGSDTTPVPSLMLSVHLAGGGEEHLRARRSSPTRWSGARRTRTRRSPSRSRCVGEFEVALELQRRVLAERVVRGEEGAELETW